MSDGDRFVDFGMTEWPVESMSWGETVCITPTVNYAADQKKSDIHRQLDEAFARTTEAINHNLYSSMWDDKPAKPRPWLSKKVTKARRYLAEHLVDIAEWIGGYSVRGDW